jgi:hypothetical protein
VTDVKLIFFVPTFIIHGNSETRLNMYMEDIKIRSSGK